MAELGTSDGKLPLTLGVLGGMGPQATVDFMARVIELTPAESDQDHIPMVVHNNPQVPDRQSAMRDGQGAPVREALTASARLLAAGGADFWVMPCNTAHAFVQDAVQFVELPFVSIIDVTIQSILQRLPDAKRLGLLATDACLSAGVYQQAVASSAEELIVLSDNEQAECMALIFAVKGGDTGAQVRDRMAALAESLKTRGAEAVIAGCTEIPLVLEAGDLSLPFVSSTEELARRAVDICLGRRPLQSDHA